MKRKKKNHRHKKRWSKKEIQNIIASADRQFLDNLQKVELRIYANQQSAFDEAQRCIQNLSKKRKKPDDIIRIVATGIKEEEIEELLVAAEAMNKRRKKKERAKLIGVWKKESGAYMARRQPRR